MYSTRRDAWQGSAGTECPSCWRRACSECRGEATVYYACECCGHRWLKYLDAPPEDGWTGLLGAVFR